MAGDHFGGKIGVGACDMLLKAMFERDRQAALQRCLRPFLFPGCADAITDIAMRN
jgi:hypothetical protein